MPPKDVLVDATIPASIQGRTALVFVDTAGSPNVRNGLIEFRVNVSGPLYMAASWTPEGNQEEVKNEIVSEEMLRAQGWTSVGQVRARTLLINPRGPLVESDYSLLVRQCRSGETFRIRTRKYRPPLFFVSGVTTTVAAVSTSIPPAAATPSASTPPAAVAPRRSGPPPAVLALTLGKDVPFRFRFVPAGSYVMGSPATETGRGTNEQQHPVTLTRPFYIGETEVTNAQFEVVGTNKSFREIADADVAHGTPLWNNAMEFVDKLNQSPLGQDYRFRLPTEAEWEYACRAGTRTAWYFGDDAGLLSQFAWHPANSDLKVHPVGKLRPNPLGLYDMHGNLFEWCSDVYADDFYLSGAQTDPQGPTTGNSHVIRGGNYGVDLFKSRSAFRMGGSAGGRISYGMRLVCEPISGLAAAPPSAVATNTSALGTPSIATPGSNVPTYSPPATIPSAPATPIVRQPVPDAKAQQTALQLVKDVFKDDYAAAKTPEQKTTLAARLLDQAKQTLGDPDSRYVLLTEARTLAIDAASHDVVRESLLLLTSEFEVDEATTILDAWNALLKRPRIDQSTIQRLHNEASGHFDAMVIDARFDDAKRFGEFASTTARRMTGVPAAVKLTTERNTALAARQKDWPTIVAAADKLKTSPDDPEANLTIARYRALVVDDWPGAFPFFVKSGDPILHELAADSLAAGSEPDALMKIGDAWWDAAQAGKPAQKQELLSGANYWYGRAAPLLTGLQKTRIDKRRAEMAAALPVAVLPATIVPGIEPSTVPIPTDDRAIPNRNFGVPMPK